MGRENKNVPDDAGGEGAIYSAVVGITSGQFVRIIKWLSLACLTLFVVLLVFVYLYLNSVAKTPPSRYFAVTDTGLIKELIGSPYQFREISQVGDDAKKMAETLFTSSFRMFQDGTYSQKIGGLFPDDKAAKFIEYMNRNWVPRVTQNNSYITGYGQGMPELVSSKTSRDGSMKLHRFRLLLNVIEDGTGKKIAPTTVIEMEVEIFESDVVSTGNGNPYKINQVAFRRG